MNGYETMSENYKILMQRGEIEKEAAEKAIRVYDFLAGCDTDDLCEMIDSSAFNDLIRAFLVRAVTSAGLDDDTIDQIMQQLRYIFDGQTAKEVLEAHFAWTNFSLILRSSRQNITVGDLFFSFSLSFFFFWPVPVLQAPDPELLPG